jgi:ketosteroid isomerase-like protein
MDDREQLIDRSKRLASAIAQRDLAAVRSFLATGFVQRPAGGDAIDADAFLTGIGQIPGDILFVRVERLTVDVSGDHAVVTGHQRAQLNIDGSVVDDQRSFVDWFVREAGDWKLRAAIEFQ